MSIQLIEALENADLLRGQAILSRVNSIPLKDLLLVAEQSLELTSAADHRPAESIFTHSATDSLSGGPHPCSSMRCRTKHVGSLARFAALYSDKVYVRNGLMAYFAHSNGHTEHESSLRSMIRDDLAIVAELRPLIEAGRIVLVTPPGDRCPRCLWEHGVSTPEQVRLTPALKKVEREFRSRVDVRLRQNGHQYQYVLDAPSDLLEHVMYRNVTTLPTEIERDPKIRRSLEAGKEISLRGVARRSTQIDAGLAKQVFRDIIFETVLSQSLNSSFLTDREVHVRVLSSLGHSPGVDRRNDVLRQHFSSVVPFAGDVPVSSLLTLRAREEEAFVLFRNELSKAINEVHVDAAGMTDRQARELYSDVVMPAVTMVERRVRLAKRDLRVAALRRAASWVGVIAVGSYAGLVPSGLQALAGVLGLAKVAQESAEMLLGKADTESNVRNDPYYFLWKVQQLASGQGSQPNKRLQPTAAKRAAASAAGHRRG